jgi:hypothetical protein
MTTILPRIIRIFLKIRSEGTGQEPPLARSRSPAINFIEEPDITFFLLEAYEISHSP